MSRKGQWRKGLRGEAANGSGPARLSVAAPPGLRFLDVGARLFVHRESDEGWFARVELGHVVSEARRPTFDTTAVAALRVALAAYLETPCPTSGCAPEVEDDSCAPGRAA